VSDKKIKENKLKGLIRFHSAKKINNYNRGGKKTGLLMRLDQPLMGGGTEAGV